MTRRASVPSWLVVLVTALTVFTVISLARGSSVQDDAPVELRRTAEILDPAPQPGGTLKVGIPEPLATLDPHQAVTEAERMVARAVTYAPFRFDFSRGLQGAAVRSWSVEDEGRTYLLELQPGQEPPRPGPARFKPRPSAVAFTGPGKAREKRNGRKSGRKNGPRPGK